MIKLIDEKLRIEELKAEKMLLRFLIGKDILFQHYTQMMEPLLIPDLYGKSIRVTEKSFPEIYKKNKILSSYFEVKPPDIFIYENFYYGAEVVGLTNPWIELSAKTLTDFDEKEINFLLGAQIAMIKHKYFINKTHANQILNSFDLIESTPGLNLINAFGTMEGFEKGFKLIYYNWNREVVHTTDLYGLMCCGSLKMSINVILKMIINDPNLVKNIDIPQYVNQKDFFNSLKGIIAYYTKYDESFPYGPTRIARLLRFLSLGEGKLLFHEFNNLRRELYV